MDSFFRPTQCRINLENISNNYHQLLKINQRNGSRFFCPMIKANAYGHGAVEVYKQLKSEGCHSFGVALVEEALALKGRVKLKPYEIIVFSKFNLNSLQVCIDSQVQPVISSMDELNKLIHLLKGSPGPVPVQIKVNTGMTRLGFGVEELGEVLKLLKNNGKIDVRGLCSHLLSGEDILQPQGRSKEQIHKFQTWQNEFRNFENCQFHIYNSGGLVGSLFEKGGIQLGARPGIALYGMCPEIHGVELSKVQEQVQLKPVMHLYTRIVQINSLVEGESVSYGASWAAKRPSLIGVLPLGYGDGYTRFFSNKGYVAIEGHIAPIVGRVCMDYCMIDITDLPNELQKLEQKVDCWGDPQLGQPYAEELARAIGTISYELTTGLTGRVPRFY